MARASRRKSSRRSWPRAGSTRPPMAPTTIVARADARLGEIFETDGRGVSVADRHRRQCAGARGAGAAVGGDLLPRGIARPRRRMRRAGILRRRRQARRHSRLRRQDHAGGFRRDAGALSARPRQILPARRAVAFAGHRGGHGLYARRDRRAGRDRPRAGHRRPHGRRPLRQRARCARRLACRNDLAGGRRRAVVRRDQERRARLRGGGVLRSRQGRVRSLSAQARRPHAVEGPVPRRADGGLSRRAGSGSNSRARQRRGARLRRGLLGAPGVRRAWPTEANEVFVVAPTARAEAWRAAGAKFHDWPTRALARAGAARRARRCSAS